VRIIMYWGGGLRHLACRFLSIVQTPETVSLLRILAPLALSAERPEIDATQVLPGDCSLLSPDQPWLNFG